MKVGDLVQTSYGSYNGVGIVLQKRRPIEKGAAWYYLIYWPNGELIPQTRGTVEVICENR